MLLGSKKSMRVIVQRVGKMPKNVKVKPNTGRNKSVVPNNGGEVLLTKFGDRSVFQVRGGRYTPRKDKGKSHPAIKAVVEQLGFDCIQLQGEISIPANSNLWPKLPD